MAHRELPCPHSLIRVEVRTIGNDALYMFVRRPNKGGFFEKTITVAEARALHELLGEGLAAVDAATAPKHRIVFHVDP